MYSIDEIKELLAAFDGSKATAVDIQLGADEYISIRQKNEKSIVTAAVPAAEAAPVIVQPAAAAAPAAAPSAPAESEGTAVESPMVGVFYAAPSPDSDPYVTVGSTVNKGDVLCLIEAMKLMNEVTAEKSGTITKVCVENGQVVEYGQPIFMIK